MSSRGRRCVSGSPEANARDRTSDGHDQQRAWEARVLATDVRGRRGCPTDVGNLPQLYPLPWATSPLAHTPSVEYDAL